MHNKMLVGAYDYFVLLPAFKIKYDTVGIAGKEKHDVWQQLHSFKLFQR